MDDGHYEVDKEGNPQAALEVRPVSSVEFDKVGPLFPPSRLQRRKGNHRGWRVAIKVKRKSPYRTITTSPVRSSRVYFEASSSIACDCYPIGHVRPIHLLPMSVCLRLPNPVDDCIPSLRPLNPKPRLRQLKLIILPPLASVLPPVLLFVTELLELSPDRRPTSVPVVGPKQQNSDRIRVHRGFERVLCRVVDQDVGVDLLADLRTPLEPIIVNPL